MFITRHSRGGGNPVSVDNRSSYILLNPRNLRNLSLYLVSGDWAVIAWLTIRLIRAIRG